MDKVFRTVIFGLCFLCTLQISFADDIDGQISLQVLHSLESGPDPLYVPRGVITVFSAKNGEASYFQERVLSNEDIIKLKNLDESNGLYRLKLVDTSDNANQQSVFSFTKACAIYQSGLSDDITVTLDQTGSIVGVALSAMPPYCTGALVPDSRLHTFNTSVNIVTLVTGPAPDTMTYIQRLEQEKAEKARGEQGDNRSFFAKYWMYIVPLIIFLFISGASSPEGQGGGR